MIAELSFDIMRHSASSRVPNLAKYILPSTSSPDREIANIFEEQKMTTFVFLYASFPQLFSYLMTSPLFIIAM